MMIRIAIFGITNRIVRAVVVHRSGEVAKLLIAFGRLSRYFSVKPAYGFAKQEFDVVINFEGGKPAQTMAGGGSMFDINLHVYGLPLNLRYARTAGLCLLFGSGSRLNLPSRKISALPVS
ncbi:hypothetical protein ACH50O_04450 [Methylomonas sp. 2BW1-5-20]|uniref:hypothetical protein n=1 Tax=Methylomonas sp. 2BW1-5-20 TaxID=3376686 RepID=UPI004052AEB3